MSDNSCIESDEEYAAAGYITSSEDDIGAGTAAPIGANNDRQHHSTSKHASGIPHHSASIDDEDEVQARGANTDREHAGRDTASSSDEGKTMVPSSRDAPC